MLLLPDVQVTQDAAFIEKRWRAVRTKLVTVIEEKS